MTATVDRAPEVAALRAHATAVVEAELRRLRSRLPAVDDAVRAELEATVRRVVDHLLTGPEERVREPGGADLAEALRDLFAPA
ncbi:hypothetical protein [Actinosynnema sp. NPDC023587]|uniref:hypothetical protein n=1 Tax=Actinosynnema sp. NPDC023587 TaxID=3154695 RepID=UPI0033C21463